jgi:hypothetical protein
LDRDAADSAGSSVDQHGLTPLQAHAVIRGEQPIPGCHEHVWERSGFDVTYQVRFRRCARDRYRHVLCESPVRLRIGMAEDRVSNGEATGIWTPLYNDAGEISAKNRR